jgi:hypothetical protein
VVAFATGSGDQLEVFKPISLYRFVCCGRSDPVCVQYSSVLTSERRQILSFKLRGSILCVQSDCASHTSLLHETLKVAWRRFDIICWSSPPSSLLELSTKQVVNLEQHCVLRATLKTWEWLGDETITNQITVFIT